MNDPEVIKFINEHTRNAANKMSSAYLEIVQHLATFNGVKNKIPNDATPIEDGREGEGISRLVCAEIYGLINLLSGLKDNLDANNGLLRDLIFKISTTKGA